MNSNIGEGGQKACLDWQNLHIYCFSRIFLMQPHDHEISWKDSVSEGGKQAIVNQDSNIVNHELVMIRSILMDALKIVMMKSSPEYS
jgi:hypothetical protein